MAHRLTNVGTQDRADDGHGGSGAPAPVEIEPARRVTRIFISYRRRDSDIWAARLGDVLTEKFPDRVFMDIWEIGPGLPWRRVLDEALSQCAALLVVIGPGWLNATDTNGDRRLDDVRDTLRREIAEALRRNVRVFPLLVNGAEMPHEDALPDDLKELAEFQGLDLTVKHWREDVAQLIRILAPLLPDEGPITGETFPTHLPLAMEPTQPPGPVPSVQSADLELAFWRRDASHFAVELRYLTPGSEADVRKGGGLPISICWEKLRELEKDPDGYALALTEAVFSDPGVRTALSEALSAAQSEEGQTLRLKVWFSSSAAPLHNLWWETLRHPTTGTPLATSGHIMFSRFLESSDWRTVRVVPKAQIKASIAIAAPSDLASHSPAGAFAPIDVSAEEARARAALADVSLTVLASNGSATLPNILAEIQNGCSVLYLVCHGSLVEGEPVLWLEDEAGHCAAVSGSALVTRLRELRDLPRLIVLAPCGSDGTGGAHGGAASGCLMALGQQLAAAGVPAVLAMQGNISTATVGTFMAAMFRSLMQHGQIDRAVAAARRAVADHPDWWVPVLFSRVKSGRLWYQAGFAGRGESGIKWRAILLNIGERNCTPILGPGLVDSYLGSRREVAERWAEEYGFPLAPHLREDFPHVAQFLAVHQQMLAFPRAAFNEYMTKELRRKYAQELSQADEKTSLNELISTVGMVKRKTDPNEPHRVLAQLPLPVYITTNFSSLLTDALIETGKKPVWDYFRWKQDLVKRPSVYKERLEQGPYEPSPEEPLVYHLFGHFSEGDSYVLTEDDYFRYLMGAIEHRRQVPEPVLRALSDTALLFLGYPLDDWSFRALFWSLIARKGGRRKDYLHVAAQLDPEEGRTLDPMRARRYLEDYFRQEDIALRINIYWGTAQHFVRDLQRYWTGEAR